MEQLTAFSAREAGAPASLVRLVNVLGSAGSVSELFLKQARAGLPLTVTDAGMVRYWISHGPRRRARWRRRAARRARARS